MSESPAEAVGAPAESAAERPSKGRPNVFARIAIFVRQVVAELKKVVSPTRAELMTYTSVVLVFLVVVMIFVTVLDYGIGELVFWVFGD